MSVQDAKLVTRRGVTEWRCPNCGQKLADLLGARVVIRVGERVISLPSSVQLDQVCWRCGITSELIAEKAAWIPSRKS